MKSRCFAFCTTVFGESAENHGLFDSFEEMEAEFKRFAAHMKANDVKTFPPESFVFVGDRFKHQGRDFRLLPVVPGYDYDIDGKELADPTQDLLLIDATDLDEFDDIEVIYLVKGKFVCGSECHSYLPPDLLREEVAKGIDK